MLLIKGTIFICIKVNSTISISITISISGSISISDSVSISSSISGRSYRDFLLGNRRSGNFNGSTNVAM